MGIYIFMGLSNQRIASLYAIETIWIGLTALLLGIGSGVLFAQLFQMILLKLSDIAIDLSFGFSLTSVLMVSFVYLIIYSCFVIKGYVNIVRSSVLDMVLATRTNEAVKQHGILLFLKAVLGCGLLALGYAFAIRKGGTETMQFALLAVILVIFGVYFIFGGCLPLLFQSLVKRKAFLYRKQRNLWINQVIFRMKKNYRTYAMVTILMICSVSALASGFAMKNRHDNIVHFRNMYTYQIMSTKEDAYDHFAQLIEQDNDIAFGSKITMLQLDPSNIVTRYPMPGYGLLAYSQLKQLAQDVELEVPFQQPGANEYVEVDKKTLMTLITDQSDETIQIDGTTYSLADYTSEPYLGYFQELTSFYLVNDETYANLRTLGQEINLYNYKIQDPYHFAASVDVLSQDPDCMALVKMDPNNDELQWVRILYSLCIFMFLVFVLASGSILFMKLYNDAFEDQERMRILQKIGIKKETLKSSITQELRFAYGMPLLLMSVSSYFSITALGNVLQSDLRMVNMISVGFVIFVFWIAYELSRFIYQRNAGIK